MPEKKPTPKAAPPQKVSPAPKQASPAPKTVPAPKQAAPKAAIPNQPLPKTTPSAPKAGDGMVYAGGTPNFNEKTGQYKPGTGPSAPKSSGFPEGYTPYPGEKPGLPPKGSGGYGTTVTEGYFPKGTPRPDTNSPKYGYTNTADTGVPKVKAQQPDVKPYGYGKVTPSAPFDKQRSGPTTNGNLSDRSANPGTLKTKAEQDAYSLWTQTDKNGNLNTLTQQGPGADRNAGNTVTIPWSMVEGGKKHLGPSGEYSGMAKNGYKAPSGIPSFSGGNMNGHAAAGVPNRAGSYRGAQPAK